ncbi:MAG: bacteriohemerythrin [Magnetococcales bacterium]|nr:bacteriohemerythrin [Magnetococcales bacterium]
MSIKLELLPEQYQLGHESIDGQHEILFQLYDELSECCKNREFRLEIELILLSLKTYIGTHFRFEERLMESADYPDSVAHKAAHHALELQVLEKISEFSTLQSDEAFKTFAFDLKTFLYDWLIDHISHTDRAFCRVLKKS